MIRSVYTDKYIYVYVCARVFSPLCLQTASAGLMEQRINELEVDKRKAASSLSSLRLQEQRMRDELASARSDLTALAAELRAAQAAKVDAEGSQQGLVQELAAALRQSDAEAQSLQITVDNLKQQLELADQSAFKRWMQEVVLNDSSLQNNSSSNPLTASSSSALSGALSTGAAPSPEGDSGTVKELVISLLVQWREQAGFYPRGATAAISRAEQRFLQRICDLVMAAHERSEAAHSSALAIEEEKAALEGRHEVIKHRLALCTEQLNR